MSHAEARFVRNEALLTALVDGELLAMSVEQGECYGLNSVATRIWELLETPRSLASLCATLLEEFEVEEAVCHRQVGAFVDRLVAERLLMVEAA